MSTFLDNVGYKGTKVSKFVYTVGSPEAGFNAAPDGVVSDFYIRDDSNNQAAVRGSRTSTTFTITEYYSDSFPVFDSTVDIFSSVPAKKLNENIQGVAGLLFIGQSQNAGHNTGRDIANADYPSTDVYEFVPSDVGFMRVAEVAPLDHLSGSTGLAITSALSYGKALKRQGVNQSAIIARAQGSTSFSGGHWVQGGANYALALTRTLEFLDEHDSHYLHTISMAIGESDAQASVTAPTFAGYLSQFASDFRADVKLGGHDIDNVPLIFLGMNSEFQAFGTGVALEAELADAPNQIPYCGYCETASYAVADNPPTNNHHNDDTQRTIGWEKLFPSRLQAMANNAASDTTITVPAGSVTLTGYAPVVSIGGNIEVTVPTGSVTLTGYVPTVTNTADTTIVVPSGTITLTGQVPDVSVTNNVSVEVPSGAVSLTGQVPTVSVVPVAAAKFLLQKGVGVTTSAGPGTLFQQWDNQEGTDNLYNLTGNSLNTPDESSGSADFFTFDLMNADEIHTLLSDADGYTLIVDVTFDATGSGTFFRGTENSINQDGSVVAQNAANTGSFGTPTTGIRTTLAVSIDHTLGTPTLKLYKDEVEVDSDTTLSAAQTESSSAGAVGFGQGGGSGGNFTLHNVYLEAGAGKSLAEISTIISTEFIT